MDMCVRVAPAALETPAMPPSINPLKAEIGLSIEFLEHSKRLYYKDQPV